jgi:hypothetical protein
MRRLAILVTLMLTTAAAPLAALCGVDCGAPAVPAVHAPEAEEPCPLHGPPAPAASHHECDHDHHVAPATAAKAEPGVAGEETLVGIACLERPAAVIADLNHHASQVYQFSITRLPLRVIPLRI